METYEDGQEWVNTGKAYQREGLFAQARDCFRHAAQIFSALGMAGLAGYCWRQHQECLEAVTDGGPVGTARYTIR